MELYNLLPDDTSVVYLEKTLSPDYVVTMEEASAPTFESLYQDGTFPRILMSRQYNYMAFQIRLRELTQESCTSGWKIWMVQYTSLLMLKTRVALIKRQTIPCLELCGTLVLAQCCLIARMCSTYQCNLFLLGPTQPLSSAGCKAILATLRQPSRTDYGSNLTLLLEPCR